MRRAWILLFMAVSICCHDQRNNVADIELMSLANVIIEHLVEKREGNGQQVDSIYIPCRHPIVIVDSLVNRVQMFSCSELKFADQTIKVSESKPQIDPFNFKAIPMRYYFIAFDTVRLGEDYSRMKVVYGPFGTTLIGDFIINNNTKRIVNKEFREIIQE